MNPLPTILSFGLLCFCLTGPVAWPFAVFCGIVFGWNVGIYYATRSIDKNFR